MTTMRELLLRVQRDADFAALVCADPDAAAAGYGLAPEELESLRRRDQSLYRFLVPAHRLQQGTPEGTDDGDLLDQLDVEPPLEVDQVIEMPPEELLDELDVEPPLEVDQVIEMPPEELLDELDVEPPLEVDQVIEMPPEELLDELGEELRLGPNQLVETPPEIGQQVVNRWMLLDEATRVTLLEEIRTFTGDARRAKLDELLEFLR